MSLDSLVKTQQLKLEPSEQKEFDGMTDSARRRLRDSQVEGLSEDGRFAQELLDLVESLGPVNPE